MSFTLFAVEVIGDRARVPCVTTETSIVGTAASGDVVMAAAAAPAAVAAAAAAGEGWVGPPHARR